jgi:hypothetical protein
MKNIKVIWNYVPPSATNFLLPTVINRMTDARIFYERGTHSLGSVEDVE